MAGRLPHLVDPAAAHHIVALVQHHGLTARDGLTRRGENYMEFIRPFLPRHAGHTRIVVADFHVHRQFAVKLLVLHKIDLPGRERSAE